MSILPSTDRRFPLGGWRSVKDPTEGFEYKNVDYFVHGVFDLCEQLNTDLSGAGHQYKTI